MPLPTSDPKAVWPPPAYQTIFGHMRQWSAWYSNDLQQLQAAYGGGAIQDSTGFFASDKGGFKATLGRTLQRFFVGEPTRGPDRNTKLPVPIAAEMCQASADLLFGEPITVTIGKQQKDRIRGLPTAGAKPETQSPTQERLDDLLDDHFHAALVEAAELAAALGGSYLRATVDPKIVPGRPFSTLVDADSALPEFVFGRLRAVTFTWVVKTVKEDVWRHLERHEFDSFGNGIVLHGLYLGTSDTLGTRIALTSIDDPALNSLALNTDVNGVAGTWNTKSPGLAVTYFPNQRPQRLWREHVIGRNLGRSDLDGVEHLMDQLAEVMSAWMRAIRLGKARIFLAKSLLKNAGPGNGMVADLEQEAYTTLETLGGKDQALKDQVQLLQPVINYEQYLATAEHLLEEILRMAGYATQTFGIGLGSSRAGGEKTATQVQSEERRSFMTRDRKIRTAKPAITDHVTKLLLLDNTFFGQSNVIDDLDVVFPDGIQETQLMLAQTVQALYAAESASIETRIGILHSEWDDPQIAIEAQRIRDEFTASAPNLMAGLDGFPQVQPGTNA